MSHIRYIHEHDPGDTWTGFNPETKRQGIIWLESIEIYYEIWRWAVIYPDGEKIYNFLRTVHSKNDASFRCRQTMGNPKNVRLKFDPTYKFGIKTGVKNDQK